MTPLNADALVVPPALAAEIQAAAEAENRPALDVLRDAVEGYRKEQCWRAIAARGADRARVAGLTEADVPRLIEEYRREKRQGAHQA